MTERQTKALKKLKLLLRHPKTMADLIEKLDVSERTVYRYLDMLSEGGVHVDRTGTGYPVKFRIH